MPWGTRREIDGSWTWMLERSGQPAFRGGLLIRLANDWELLDSSSSGTNLGRWDARVPDSIRTSRAAPVRTDEYEGETLAGGDRTFTVEEEASLVGSLLDVFRAVPADCGPV